MYFSCIYLLILHALIIFCPFSLPLCVESWLWLVIEALPGRFYYFFVLSIVLFISLGEEKAGLCTSRGFISLFCTRRFFVLFLFLLVSGVGCGL